MTRKSSMERKEEKEITKAVWPYVLSRLIKHKERKETNRISGAKRRKHPKQAIDVNGSNSKWQRRDTRYYLFLECLSNTPCCMVILYSRVRGLVFLYFQKHLSFYYHFSFHDPLCCFL